MFKRGWQEMKPKHIKTSAGYIWKPEKNRENKPDTESLSSLKESHPPHLDHLTAAHVERVPEESRKKLGLKSPQRKGLSVSQSWLETENLRVLRVNKAP